MTRASLHILTVALLSLISGHARADIWVEYYNISDVLRTRTFHAPGAPIQLSLASTDFYVRVFSLPPANDSIGLITSGGSGSQVVSLFVARSITFDTVFQTLSGGMHWAGLNDVQNRIRLRSYVTGNLTGDVTAREIVTLRVGGAIQANVSTTIASPAPFFIRAEAGTASGSTLSSAASVGLIQIPNGGNLFSNVHAATYIGQIAVTGNIGSPSAPVAISAGSPNVGNNLHLNTLIATNLNATISTGAPATPHVAVGTIDIDQDVGANSVLSLSSFGIFEVDRDFAGTVNMNQPLASGRTLLIGRSLVSGAAVNLPSNGLAGQVTINNGNISGAMSGAISVGGSALSGPYYTNTAASLGGGSVGLASFALHDESCFPPNNGSMSGTMLDIGSPYLECVPVDENEAVLRFYGPVAISGSGAAVKVEYATFGLPNSWSTVTSSFLTAIDSADHRRVVVTRNPSVGAAWPLGRYRMTRLDNRLLSEGVGAGSPPQVQTFTYIVDVIDECEGLLGLFDLNDDGTVSVAGDVPVWLGSPTDFNGDAAADSDDLNLLLQAAELFDE